MKLYLFLIGFFIIKDANAYLDPGSGNALVYLLFSVIGVFIYYVKKIYYRILSYIHGNKIEKRKEYDISIFSEGKNYWLTYKPIVEELIKNNLHFTYYTMDVEDPALRIDNVYMHSRFIGKGHRAYAKIGLLKTRILLTTTPNIGCPKYPIKRPLNVNKLVHIWHSLCDSSCYHLGALDYYDVALTVGDWVSSPLREVEKSRNIKEKEIIPIGLPYFDELKVEHDKNIKITNSKNDKSLNSKKGITILLSPSWGNKSCLRTYGTIFIDELLKEGFQFIIRPHPQSLKVERNFIKKLEDKYKTNKSVLFDFSTNSTDSMMKSDMMISDKSGIRFDYSLIYEKPVLTLDIPTDNLKDYEASILGRLWGDKESELIGIRLKTNQKDCIVDAVKKTLLFSSTDLIEIRKNVLSNYGSSAKKAVEWLKKETLNF